MTAPLLLLLIGSSLLLQLALGAGIAFARHRRADMVHPDELDQAHEHGSSGAWRGLRDFRVVARTYEDDARTQCSFTLEPVDGAPLDEYEAGQFLTFELSVVDGDGESPADRHTVTRCYSLSDRPDPARFQITVKRALAPMRQATLPPGVASTYLHDQVHVGDVLRIRAPAGRFVLDPDASIPTVLVGGGIGITPLMSMLRWSLATEPRRVIHLFYGVRCGAEHAFKAALEQLAASHAAFHLHVSYATPGDGDVEGRDYQHTGYVDVALLRRLLPEGRHAFYVCGPPPMMQTLVPALRSWGVAEADVHFEAFGPATVPPAATAHVTRTIPLDVQFKRSARTLVWDGTDATLLDLAERSGIEIDTGCRTGSCGSCETRLVSGTVRYAHTPQYVMRPGHCLLCVGTAETALVVDA